MKSNTARLSASGLAGDTGIFGGGDEGDRDEDSDESDVSFNELFRLELVDPDIRAEMACAAAEEFRVGWTLILSPSLSWPSILPTFSLNGDSFSPTSSAAPVPGPDGKFFQSILSASGSFLTVDFVPVDGAGSTLEVRRTVLLGATASSSFLSGRRILLTRFGSA